MKVLIVCQHFYPEMFSVNDVAMGLVKRGHEVLVVTGRPNYGYGHIIDGYECADDEFIHGVRVHHCDLKPRKNGRLSITRNYLSFWKSSKRYLKKLDEHFDVVYSMSLSPLISVVGGTIYARRHHVRHVLHCLDLWPESTLVTGAVRKGSLTHRILLKWCRKIYSNLDEILISSPSFASYFHDVLHVDNVPLSVVPQPPQISLPNKKIEYTSPVNFVYAGNIGNLQLVEELVLAAGIAAKTHPLKLHLIGMGARVERVKKLIKEKGLSDVVTFYGIKPRSEVSAFYENATAIVVPLKNEGYVGKTIPNKLNSSMYFAKPILAVLEGDGKTVLEESGGAIFSKGERPEDIAEAMVRLASLSEDERQKLGQNNADYFAKHFELEKVLDEITEHLK